MVPVFGKVLENGAGGGGTCGEIFAINLFEEKLGGGGGAGADNTAGFDSAFECRGGGGEASLADITLLFSGTREEIESLKDAASGTGGWASGEDEDGFWVGVEASLMELEGGGED